MITYIPIDQLYPHWDNPRKDLGDLSELAESIKARGVMQNLTVVPGHKLTGEEWHELVRQYGRNPNEQTRILMNSGHSSEGYTVVIGHRRMAASKIAGLTELPCVVSDMDYKTQISTMLLENMQRSDLTVYEQARGFQMMLDLGDSVPIIAEQTGFSETTVRSRVKLLELDEKEFKASEKKNVTLAEYAKLNKIENIERRNVVLKAIGTNNFDHELQRALDLQRERKYADAIIQQCKTFATKIDNTKDKRYIASYALKANTEVHIPDDAKTKKYYYTDNGYAIALYVDDPNGEVDAKDEEKKRKIEERRRALRAESKTAKELRMNFIKNMSDAEIKKHQVTAIRSLIPNLIYTYSDIKKKDVAELMDLPETFVDGKELEEDLKVRPERYLLVIAYLMMEPYSENYYSYMNAEYEKNEHLDELYEFLKEIGYEMSDDEKALQDGTHELFKKD